jgi:hypothetical protein
MDRPAHRRTSPVAHLTDDFLLVVIVRLVWETCPELMFVKNLCLRVGNTYIGETWYEHRHGCENLWDLWFLWYMWSLLCIWWLCDICDVYVMIMWYIFCLFGWNRINKLKKGYSGHFSECQGQSTWQRRHTWALVKPLCRVLWPWHSAKKQSLPSAS